MTDAADVRSMHIPPDTRHVAAIRSFVGAVGRAAGCSQETIEDLRLAATEACAQALEQAAAPDGIDVRVSGTRKDGSSSRSRRSAPRIRGPTTRPRVSDGGP